MQLSGGQLQPTSSKTGGPQYFNESHLLPGAKLKYFVDFIDLLRVYVQQFPDLKIWVEGRSPYFISGGSK